MFRKEVKSIDELLKRFLREEGLETPLLQQRIVSAWDTVAGTAVARYTGEKYIKNQVLFVKILNPALRQDLSMMRAQLVRRLNEAVGASVITDVHIF
jgi:predicted nucleic acid-binding Zn ribbon protein